MGNPFHGLVDGAGPAGLGVATHWPTRRWENHNSPVFFANRTNGCSWKEGRARNRVRVFLHTVQTCATVGLTYLIHRFRRFLCDLRNLWTKSDTRKQERQARVQSTALL